MKYVVILLGVCFSLCSCRTLKSTTYIEPEKSFILGEGSHGSYKAQLTNVDEVDIEIVLTDIQGQSSSLGILSSGVSTTVKILANQQVSLINKGVETAAMRIEVRGDTRLSMGYQ